jgi:hypothetical protein
MSQADGAPDTVEGAYSIQVASYSSDWSNAGSVTILNTGSSLPPAPTSIVPYSATPNTWVLNGTGFKATNDIQLTPSSGAAFIPEDSHTASAFDAFMKVLKNLFFKTASAQTTSSGYIIPGVSGNSTSVTFEVPVSVPNGTYTVSVRSTNTAWANTSYKITVTGHGGAGSGTTPGTTPVTTPTPPPPVQTGPSFPATISYSCASGYTLTGTSCYKPAYTVTTPAGFTNPWQPQAFGPYSCAANPLFSIPAGATLGAKAGYTNGVCYYPAVTTTVPASTISAAQYSCPSGYLLGGTTCNIINTVAITPPSPGAVTAGGANINYICPAGTGSLSTDSSGNPTCQKPMTVSGGSCPGGYGPHFSATQDGAPCYSLSATTLIQGNYFSKPTTTYTCADGTSLSGTICVSGVGAFSASNLSSAATSALCPVGYTLQSNNTCLWPGVRAVTSASYTKNSDGNLFQDPRFDFGNGQVAIAADATTAKKWCQTLDTIDTSLKFSDGNVVSNSSITGTAASFDGTKWKVVSNAKYAASLKCTGSGGPSAGVTNAVSFCATGYKTVSGTCVSTTPPGTTTGTVPATIKYTCSSGSLSGNSCISTTTNGTGIDPKITHTCPTGYRLRTSTNTQCRASNGFNVNTASTSASFIPSTPLYSCKTGYTLNTADKRCYLPSKIKTTPAIPSYICPSGYILNTTAKTCSPVVAIKKANIASLSTSTANVWDGLENWIGWVVWIAK